MKTKLLKALRKDFNFKFRDGTWHVLVRNSQHVTFNDLDSVIRFCLSENSYVYDHLLDWSWDSIKEAYVNRVETRKFNKL